MLRIFRGDGGGKKTVIPEAALPPHFVIPEIVEDDYPGSPPAKGNASTPCKMSAKTQDPQPSIRTKDSG
jgi:hypothetical protein